MAPGEGLWLIPSRGIHTFGMLFPIDVVYLDSRYRVVHLVEFMRPFRFSRISLSGASVLELPAHTIYASQTRVGDQLQVWASGAARAENEPAPSVAAEKESTVSLQTACENAAGSRREGTPHDEQMA